MTEQEHIEITARLFRDEVTAAEEAGHKTGLTADGRVNEATAAMLVGVYPDTLYRWRITGTGPDYFRVNGRLTYSLHTLAHWVHTCRVASGSETR